MRAIALLLSLASVATAQGVDSTVSIPFSRTHDFRSKINGRDYSIFVALPPGYSPFAPRIDTTRYPVLYLADGNISLPLAWSVQRQLAQSGFAGNVILVGIAYPTGQLGARRVEDYSLASDTAADRRYSTPAVSVKTGGAPALLRVIREEVIPLIESTYKTSRDRDFIGVSMGGLFGSYILTHDPTLFRSYTLGSPAFWWNDRLAFTHEKEYAATHKDMNARVFVWAGEREGELRDEAMRYAALLKSRGYPNLRLTTGVVPSADHSTSWHDDVTRTIRALYYPPVKCTLSRTADTLYSGQCARNGNPVHRMELRTPRAGEPNLLRGRTIGAQPNSARPSHLVTTAGAEILRGFSGWYHVEGLRVDGSAIEFQYDWDSEIDATESDLDVLKRARAKLSVESRWSRSDEGEVPTVTCRAGATRLSVFCALTEASREVYGDFYWASPAVNELRDAIIGVGREYQHWLTGLNKDPVTTFAEIRSVFEEAIAQVEPKVRLASLANRITR